MIEKQEGAHGGDLSFCVSELLGKHKNSGLL